MPSSRRLVFCVAVLTLFTSSVRAVDEVPQVQELRCQQVGNMTYFHVRLEPPANLRVPPLQAGPYAEWERRLLAQLPQLVPQDGAASAVYLRVVLPHFRPNVKFNQRLQVPVKGLEFVGKVQTSKKARFLLLYPTDERGSPPAGIKERKALAELLRPVRWGELPVKLDLARATVVAGGDDNADSSLENLWAEAQAARLAVLEALAPESGFFGFACAATGRKYGVTDPVLESDRIPETERIHRRMFDLTTGTTAITQSLALDRVRRSDFPDRGPRTVDIAKVPGIDIAEHPWKKMMNGKRPGQELLARLVPHDNYYIHFKSFRKFTELGDLLDQIGTNATRAFEINSREYDLKERYERQLCLKSTRVGRTLGPYLIRSLAITGSDPYVREGSDITILFHVKSRATFLAGVEPFLEQARQEFGDRLKETKEDYHGIRIERFVTPLREVSLHRAAFEEFVVCSNSAVALQRVLDTRRAQHKSLWDSLDFQYMRTVFSIDDEEEDGFAFLSDAFLRQLVGPASKIKEARRLEALTSLAMLTHGAMFTAWETGKLPADHDALMDAARLQPAYLYMPEGKHVRWDPARQAAVSDAYNTLHFATPLIELPIDKITAHEEKTYRKFRQEYLQLWRQFFDPVGIRLSLNDRRVKAEVYVLPLVNSDEYRQLRAASGGGTINIDPAKLSPKTLLQFSTHADGGFLPWDSGLGKWHIFRADDGPGFRKLVELWIEQTVYPRKDDEPNRHTIEFLRVLLDLPITAGSGLHDEAKLHKKLKELGEGLGRPGPNSGKVMYKKTPLTHLHYGGNSAVVNLLNAYIFNSIREKVSSLDVHHAVIDDGWYIGLSQRTLKDLVDRGSVIREGARKDKEETVPVNASLYISPRAAVESGNALRFYLEWETHRRALPNNALWYAMHRSHLVDEKTTDAEKRAAALKFLGFIPVSPDDTAYVYDAERDEVVSQRHGTLRRPRLHGGLADTSPLTGLLTQFPALRVDLRFREDGLHTILTIDRQQPARNGPKQ